MNCDNGTGFKTRPVVVCYAKSWLTLYIFWVAKALPDVLLAARWWVVAEVSYLRA